MAMRAKVVDKYIKKVLDKNDERQQKWVQVIEQIYRLNLDNRILNNLRQQLNEEIDDERGLVGVNIFRKMFFTFFKGEKSSHQVYEMLWPCIREYFNYETDCTTTAQDPNGSEIARIVALTAFIDLFNYYPLRVCKVRYKNDSNELTFIMNSNTRGTKNDRGEVLMPKPEPKTDEERYLQ
jgi:hypothetical protein